MRYSSELKSQMWRNHTPPSQKQETLCISTVFLTMGKLSFHISNWTQAIKLMNLDNDPLSNYTILLDLLTGKLVNVSLKLSFKFIESKPTDNEQQVENMQQKAQTDTSLHILLKHFRMLLLPAVRYHFTGGGYCSRNQGITDRSRRDNEPVFLQHQPAWWFKVTPVYDNLTQRSFVSLTR